VEREGGFQLETLGSSDQSKKPNYQQNGFGENPQNFPDHEAHKTNPPRENSRGESDKPSSVVNYQKRWPHRSGARLKQRHFTAKPRAEGKSFRFSVGVQFAAFLRKLCDRKLLTAKYSKN
jgi:hypothetical protein